ncbi:gephyrin-like molybdotransferase receptor GlpR [Streptomyces sp. PT12]|uniref:divisome protein SepX/GlpR n=1 Tax=Streptomyces sp. PT12 TaxID=1510197 RepID=UPI00215C0A5E|nr:gephyrin-like molybdotransferase receptor GlpR [Streptomyces sp. PT12]
MSSSGLIFAVIVGAWAAYLVPMWLRRQDELNEARPTERFSTAIRLLTRGRRAQEAEATAQDDPNAPHDAPHSPHGGHDDSPSGDPGADEGGAARPSADVRAFAKPVTAPKPAATPNPRAPRTKVLVRRRRTTMALLLAFTLGGIFTLSTGPGFLWLPAIPAALLIAYVVHVRRQERRRYAVALDRRRAEEAARRLRERTQKSASAVPEQPSARIVEQTEHAEWVDQERRRAPAAAAEEPESWDPAPVPLPTYVSAPVAPRTTRGVDLDAPDTWSAARSTTAGSPPAPPTPRADPKAPQRTPLFDQYAEEDHRRAAGE